MFKTMGAISDLKRIIKEDKIWLKETVLEFAGQKYIELRMAAEGGDEVARRRLTAIDKAVALVKALEI